MNKVFIVGSLVIVVTLSNAADSDYDQPSDTSFLERVHVTRELPGGGSEGCSYVIDTRTGNPYQPTGVYVPEDPIVRSLPAQMFHSLMGWIAYMSAPIMPEYDDSGKYLHIDISKLNGGVALEVKTESESTTEALSRCEIGNLNTGKRLFAICYALKKDPKAFVHLEVRYDQTDEIGKWLAATRHFVPDGYKDCDFGLFQEQVHRSIRWQKEDWS